MPPTLVSRAHIAPLFAAHLDFPHAVSQPPIPSLTVTSRPIQSGTSHKLPAPQCLYPLAPVSSAQKLHCSATRSARTTGRRILSGPDAPRYDRAVACRSMIVCWAECAFTASRRQRVTMMLFLHHRASVPSIRRGQAGPQPACPGPCRPHKVAEVR